MPDDMTTTAVEEVHAKVLDAVAKGFPAYGDPRFSVVPANHDTRITPPTKNYYCYLYELVRLIQPRKILELGTSQGYSALFMLLALPKSGMLVTVDLLKPPFVALAKCMDDSRLHIVSGNDLNLGIYGSLNLRGIDLLFIDSLHEHEQIRSEWALYEDFLNDGAIVVMDDIHMNEGMTRFWDELPYPKVDTGKQFHWSGWGIVRFRRPCGS